jgi:hypothetical protein
MVIKDDASMPWLPRKPLNKLGREPPYVDRAGII